MGGSRCNRSPRLDTHKNPAQLGHTRVEESWLSPWIEIWKFFKNSYKKISDLVFSDPLFFKELENPIENLFTSRAFVPGDRIPISSVKEIHR